MAFARTSLVLILLGVSSTSVADPIDALYSAESVEIKADAGLFTLMLVMNALGWDEAAQAGPPPLRRPIYDKLRNEVRGKLFKYRSRYLSDGVLRRFEDFYRKHPQPLEDYIAYTMSLGPEPHFEPSSPPRGDLAKLKGLERLLATAWKQGRLHVFMNRFRSKFVHRMRSVMSRLDGKTDKLALLFTGTPKSSKAKAKDSDDDLDDLFGEEEGEGDGEEGAESDVTTNFELVSASVAPLWLEGRVLRLRLGGRAIIVLGGNAPVDAVVHEFVLSRLRGWAGLVEKPVTTSQNAAVLAILSKIGLSQSQEFPAGCRAAVDQLLTDMIPLKAPGEAEKLINSCKKVAPATGDAVTP